MALEGDPRDNKNFRGNPSLLIRHRTPDNGIENVLIDAGKTFREAGQRWLPQYAPGGLHAAIFTHEHADAVLGIDDLRGVQAARPLPIFASQQCLDRLACVFPYLLPKATENRNPRLFVASLDWRVLDGPRLDDEAKAEEGAEGSGAAAGSGNAGQSSSSSSPLPPPSPPPQRCVFSPAAGLEVEAFALEHGPRFLSLGFSFGPRDAKFVYLSDVSRVPPHTLTQLQAYAGIATLVVDCLDPGDRGFVYPTHFSLPQALALVRALKPQKTLLVGMTHAFEHHAGNARLAKLLAEEGLDVQLAYDGQCVHVG